MSCKQEKEKSGGRENNLGNDERCLRLHMRSRRKEGNQSINQSIMSQQFPQSPSPEVVPILRWGPILPGIAFWVQSLQGPFLCVSSGSCLVCITLEPVWFFFSLLARTHKHTYVSPMGVFAADVSFQACFLLPPSRSGGRLSHLC